MLSDYELKQWILDSKTSKKRDTIVQLMLTETIVFDTVFSFLKDENQQLVQYAVGSISYAAVHQPALIKNKWKWIMEYIQNNQLHGAVRRCFLYVLENTPIPVKWHGQVIDFCFNFINKPTEKVAVKAYALTIIEKLTVLYPELIPELIGSIEMNMEHAQPAFLSRAKKILKKYRKLNISTTNGF